MQTSSTPERTGGPRFQRRITDEPSIFRRTITGRWLLKMATYNPQIEGRAVEACTSARCTFNDHPHHTPTPTFTIPPPRLEEPTRSQEVQA